MVWIADAEALAFAVQLPAIKALVEDVRMVVSALVREGKWAEFVTVLRKDLEPFGEADDAT